MWPLTKLYVSCFQVSYLSENKSRMSNFICLYDYSDENLYIMMCSRSCPDPPKPLPMDLSVVELLPKERFHDLIEATLVDNRGYSEGTEKQQQQRIVEMNWSTGIRTITSPTKACEKKTQCQCQYVGVGEYQMCPRGRGGRLDGGMVLFNPFAPIFQTIGHISNKENTGLGRNQRLVGIASFELTTLILWQREFSKSSFWSWHRKQEVHCRTAMDAKGSAGALHVVELLRLQGIWTGWQGRLLCYRNYVFWEVKIWCHAVSKTISQSGPNFNSRPRFSNSILYQEKNIRNRTNYIWAHTISLFLSICFFINLFSVA